MNIKCQYKDLVDLHVLQPNPKNPNKHPKNQIERLAQIIDYQGMRSPIVVSKRSGFITKGHGRLEALKQLKWQKAPVDYQEYEDEAQEYADMVADNAIAEWAAQDLSEINLEMIELGPDFDVDMLGIENFTIEPIEKYDEATQDDVPEVKHDPITKRGDVWLLGEHRVMCGDSTMIDDVEKLMNGEKADMVFTDPPYGDNHASMEMNRKNMKKGKGPIVSKVNKIKNDSDISFLEEVAANSINFLKEKAPKLVFFKWSKWELIKKYFGVYGEPNSCCVWDKEKIAAATYIFNPVHEFAFFWGSLANKKNKSNLTNVWRCLKEKENKHLHPTVKPIEICENAIDAACENRGLVLDLFLGSGSTLIACEKTNRKCYGMELDEHYCDIIVERWQKYTGKQATLESTGKTYGTTKEGN